MHCRCTCHRFPGVKHVIPCCDRCYELDEDVKPEPVGPHLRRIGGIIWGEQCLGCGKFYADRDCGCPCGSRWAVYEK